MRKPPQKGKAYIEAWILQNRLCTSHNLPNWFIRLRHGDQEDREAFFDAMTRLFLEKHSEESTQTYETSSELQAAILDYISRVEFIMDIEEIRHKSKKFNYRPVEIFSFEEPSITILSIDDDLSNKTIEEIIEESKRKKRE